VRQIGLVRRLESEPLAVSWRSAEGNPFTELTVCARDTRGLFARIAGTLTAHGVNILSVDVATRRDGIAIDTFVVCEMGGPRPVAAERQPALEAALEAAVVGRLDVAAAVEAWRAKVRRPRRRTARLPVPPSVRFDSQASADSTVVEVRAEDAPGLAYTIASTLAALGLDITFAKIATEKNDALDVFYVADGEGRKLDLATIPDVERALLDAIGRPAAGAIVHAVPARSTA